MQANNHKCGVGVAYNSRVGGRAEGGVVWRVAGRGWSYCLMLPFDACITSWKWADRVLSKTSGRNEFRTTFAVGHWCYLQENQ